MLRNDRQLRNTRAKVQKLLEAIEQTANEEDRESLCHLVRELEADIDEYAAITSGRKNVFLVEEFDRLWEAVVKARLARGWTQRRFAAALGVSEQMVQKDEAGGYQRASLSRLAEAMDVLGYGLSAIAYPHESTTPGAVTRVLVSDGIVTGHHLPPDALVSGHLRNFFNLDSTQNRQLRDAPHGLTDGFFRRTSGLPAGHR